MTSNQIEYAKHLETKRHNLVVERQQDIVTNEAIRHNKAGESATFGNLAELTRHNLETEALSKQQIVNNYIVGSAQAGAAYAHAAAAMKSAEASLLNAEVSKLSQQEAVRHNQAMENNQFIANLTQQSSVNNSFELGMKNAEENIRHNQQMEKITRDTAIMRSLADIVGSMIKVG